MHRRTWWIPACLLVALACLVASEQNLGGYGDLLAVPPGVVLLLGFLWLWRWEQGRKRRGSVTYGEELTKAALTGPFSLLGALLRGPRPAAPAEPRPPSPAPTTATAPAPRSPQAAETPPVAAPGPRAATARTDARFDLGTDDGLRAFLEALGRAEGVALRAPARPGQLEAAEAALGRPLPALLRRVLSLTDGLRRDLLLPLGEANPSLLESHPERAGMLGAWAFFREAADLPPELVARATGELGYDLLPIATHEHEGGPVISLSLVTGEVYEHHGGEPAEAPLAAGLDAWLLGLLP